MFFCLGIVPAYYFNALGYEKLFLYFVLCFTVSALAGMVLSLNYFETAVSVLYGLIISCIAGMAIINALLDKVMNGRVNIPAVLFLLIPSILSAMFVILPLTPLKVFVGLAALAAIYRIYIMGKTNQFKLLFRSW
jgi:hypothetical protein